jgi:hypothetical protein
MDGRLILRRGRIGFLPEEHPDRALSRLAKCVAAFVNLEPRRKKSVDILTKSSAVLVKNMGNLTKSAAILVKNKGNLTKNTAILVKSEGVLIKSKGTPTLSPIILLILSNPFLLLLSSCLKSLILYSG